MPENIIPEKFSRSEVSVYGNRNSKGWTERAIGFVVGSLLAAGASLALNVTFNHSNEKQEQMQRIILGHQMGIEALSEGVKMHKAGVEACFGVPATEMSDGNVYFHVKVVPCDNAEVVFSTEDVSPLTTNTEEMINTVLGRPFFKGGDMSEASIHGFSTAAEKAENINKYDFEKDPAFRK